MQHYLIRYGWQREICKVRLSDNHRVNDERLLSKRGQRVIVDCGRGMELGECLGGCPSDPNAPTGTLYRLMAPEDELLMGQLAELAQLAYEQCVAWLSEAGLEYVLLEVEPLIDGKTLLFHFLNDPDEIVQEHMDYLSRLYAEQVSQSEFAKKIEAGCGPDCGTAKASCGTSTGCSGCAAKCSVKKAQK